MKKINLKKVILFLIASVFCSYSDFSKIPISGLDFKKEKEEDVPERDPNKLNISLYGYIKGDAIYTTSVDNMAQNAAPHKGADNSEFYLEIRQTRLGIDFEGPKIFKDGKLNGVVEVDFWSNTKAIANIRLRLAYVELKHPFVDILVGQALDFFSPIDPTTLNFANLWWGGNLGYRHPQIVLTKNIEDSWGGNFFAQLAVVDQNFRFVVTNKYKGYPVIGGRAGWENDSFMLGLSFSGGKAKNYLHKNSHTWLGLVNSTYKIKDSFEIQGEAYLGDHLSVFMGSDDNLSFDGQDAFFYYGGWLQLTAFPSKKISVNVGGGFNCMQPLKIEHQDRSLNSNATCYVNFFYEFVKNLKWGIEYQYFHTKYTPEDINSANRLQSSLIYSF